MAKTKKEKRAKPINYAEFPLIGYEYEYLSQPVRIKRVCPGGGPDFAHIEFENRYCERSSCDSGELGKWQDTDKPLTKSQASMAFLDLNDAIEDATTDVERKLAQWQLKRLEKLSPTP